jgi:hypothetical protein
VAEHLPASGFFAPWEPSTQSKGCTGGERADFVQRFQRRDASQGALSRPWAGMCDAFGVANRYSQEWVMRVRRRIFFFRDAVEIVALP